MWFRSLTLNPEPLEFRVLEGFGKSCGSLRSEYSLLQHLELFPGDSSEREYLEL